MSRKVKGLIILGFVLCVIFFLNRYFNTTNHGTTNHGTTNHGTTNHGTTNHGTTTSGIVIDKESNPKSISLKTFGETANEIKVTRILIEDENIWNLIELNRYYFVTYEWKNNEIPRLGQIMINDEFGEIYNDELND